MERWVFLCSKRRGAGALCRQEHAGGGQEWANDVWANDVWANDERANDCAKTRAGTRVWSIRTAIGRIMAALRPRHGSFVTARWGGSRGAILGLVALALIGGFMPAKAQSQDDIQHDTVTTAPLAPPSAGVTLDLRATEERQGEVFRVGFLADAAPGHQRQQFVPFRAHLEEVLNRPVEMVGYRDARNMILALQRGQALYAIAPASILIAAHRQCACVAPLASQPNRDGSSGLFAVMLARDDGPVDGIADLDGQRVVIVGEGSVMAHRIGLAELWRADVRPEDDALSFAPTLSAAVALLEAGEADAILSWSRQADGRTLFDAEPADALAPDQRGALRIMWRSRPVPGISHFASTRLDADQLALLQTMLVDLTGTDGDAFDAIDQGSGRPFAARSMADYRVLTDAFSFWDGAARQPDPSVTRQP